MRCACGRVIAGWCVIVRGRETRETQGLTTDRMGKSTTAKSEMRRRLAYTASPGTVIFFQLRGRMRMSRIHQHLGYPLSATTSRSRHDRSINANILDRRRRRSRRSPGRPRAALCARCVRPIFSHRGRADGARLKANYRPLPAWASRVRNSKRLINGLVDPDRLSLDEIASGASPPGA